MKRPRVLIAEDETIIRLDLKEILEEADYEVVAEAADGQTALDLAERLNPDLAVLDIKMPVKNGLETAEEITAKGICPVVILTAFSQRSLVEEAVKAGALAYIVKPFSKNDLIPAIEVARARFEEKKLLENQVKDLEERLETRKLVEKAKGFLMSECGLGEAEAFRLIQKRSMDSQSTLRSVASAIIAGKS